MTMFSDRVHKLVNEMGTGPLLPEMSGRSSGIMVTLVYRTSTMQIQIELQDTHGVRATSLLCLLGLGLGLGSILIYRLCSRILYPSSLPRKRHNANRRKRHRPSQCLDDLDTVDEPKTPRKKAFGKDYPSPETPSDSGISTASTYSTMGTVYSDQSAAGTPDSPSVLYTATDGVRFRNFHGETSLSDGNLSSLHLQGGNSTVDEDIFTHRDHKGHRSTQRQLTIDIPLEESEDRGCTATVSSLSSIGSLSPRQKDADRFSLGAFSMKPNYSPRSLYEKNLRLSDIEHNLISESLEIQDNEAFNYATDNNQNESKGTVDCQNNDTMLSSVSELENSSLYYSCTGPDLLPNALDFQSPLTEGASDMRHSTPLSDGKCDKIPLPAVEHILADDAIELAMPTTLQDQSPISDSLDPSESFSMFSEEDGSSKELTFSKGSLDYSENVSGMATPDSDLFCPSSIGLKTAVNIETIQNELQSVYRDLDDINHQMTTLNVRSSPIKERTIEIAPNLVFHNSSLKGSEFRNALRVLKRHHSREEGSFYRSQSASDECKSPERDLSSEQQHQWQHSYHNSVEFMWDYGSDLATLENPAPDTAEGRDQFVMQRPYVGGELDTVKDTEDGTSSAGAPSFEHVRAYLRSLDSDASLDLTNASSGRQESTSMADIYIDDDLSGLRTGGLSMPPTSSKEECIPDFSVHGLSQDTLSDLEFTSDMASSESRSPRISSHRGSVDSSHEEQATNRLKHLADKNAPVSVGQRTHIPDYVEHEWRGQTPAAEIMRKGYLAIPHTLALNQLRRIRGDNYCAIRATLYQILINNFSTCSQWKDTAQAVKSVDNFRQRDYSYMTHWSFAGRIQSPPNAVWENMEKCIQCLFAQLEAVTGIDDATARETYVTELLNSDPDIDVRIMEATKLLMMAEALRLYSFYKAGEDVPTFVWLMFARDSSLNPRDFFLNHLDGVGDSHGLEMVEMYLLSHTLGIAIQVIRPSCFNQSDFITTFVDEDTKTDLPTVMLIAEDDRHYNVVLP